MKYSGLISLFAAALTASCFAEVEWEPEVYPRNNLFPSLVIGTARVDPNEEIFAAWTGHHLGDPQGIVGATVTGLESGDEVALTVEANDFMKESRVSGKAAGPDDLTVHPKVSYHYERLAGISEAVPLDITMQLEVNGESLGKKTVTVTLRPVNDCLYAVDEGEQGNSDYSWLFAAYVNENHPWVDKILRKALETGIVDSFDGYQSEDEESVILQIFAVWNVMQRLGMRYSDVTTTAAESDGVHSQHVRLFEESVESSQANCVDGSVLLAAVLRKIGLKPYLVLVPGHMYLAVDLSEDTTIGIETTLMGESKLKAANLEKLPAFENLAPKDQEGTWEAFESAVAVGTEALDKESDRFVDPDELEFQIIDIGEARQYGILPIRSGKPKK